MDRRTLIFLALLFGTLFFVNLYFTREQQEQERVWQLQQKAKQELIEKEKANEIAERTASLASLPLVEIYADDAGSQFLTDGVKVDDALLTISWSEHPNLKVFARAKGSTDPLVPHFLNIVNTLEGHKLQDVGNPLLYSTDGKGSLPVWDMPFFGDYDLQLITFYPDNPTKPVSVSLGKFSDGRFTSYRQDLNGNRVPPPALVLFKSPKGYYPVGLLKGPKEIYVDLDEYDSLEHFVVKEVKVEEKKEQAQEEKYYVLENGYLQLVFSNVGGSITEINLPFEKSKSAVSVVKPVEVDRKLIQDDPRQATYPLYPYYTPGDKEPVLNKKGTLGEYYPLLRRDFFDPGTQKTDRIPPEYRALNVVSEYPELAQLVYEVKEFDNEHIVFVGKQDYRTITKTYRLLPTDKSAPYVFDLDVNIEGDNRNLWLTSGVPEAEWIAGSLAPALKYRLSRGKKGSVESIDLPSDAVTNTSVNPDWVCNSNGFFGVILDPLNDAGGGYKAMRVPGGTAPSRLIALEKEHPDWNEQDLPGYMALMPVKTTNFRFFAGPFATKTLNKVDAQYTDPLTGENPDYISCQTYHGFFTFISQPFAKLMWWIMDFCHFLTGSWGLSIFLLTIVLRVLLYPLNTWSTKSMLKMQEVAPEVARIQEKYKGNKQKAQMEILELYRKKKVSPLGGCLPLLIQMPFLIGMFDLLKSSFELRGASFIPGWIDDLSAPDVLFTWNFHIPFFGSAFHLLPFILGGLMFIQSRMSSNAPKDVSQMTDQQRQQRAMMTIMPLFMTFIFYKFPSGLNLYWISSTLLGMLQQWRMKRKLNKA